MATDYHAKLTELAQPRTIASKVSEARALLGKYGAWIRRYHGGMPVGIMAAIMAAESGGKMSAPGDVSLGEVGFYQITSSLPGEVGLPAESRYDPETNVFLGAIEYQLHAADASARWGVPKGSPDQWRLARLMFSIGNSGTADLVRRAVAAFPVASSGSVWKSVVAYTDSVGGVAYGSQSADKVWFRVRYVDYIFGIGLQVGGRFGPPQVVPAPPKYPKYTFPAKLLPFTGRPAGTLVVTLAAAVVAGVILARST